MRIHTDLSNLLSLLGLSRAGRPPLALFAVTIFASGVEAIAQTAEAVPPAGPPGILRVFSDMLPLIIMVWFIFYFLVTRPQQRRLKAQEDLHNALKKGDLVLTSSGIIARVSGIEPDHLVLEIASNVKVKFLKSHVTQKVELAKPEKSETKG